MTQFSKKKKINDYRNTDVDPNFWESSILPHPPLSIPKKGSNQFTLIIMTLPPPKKPPQNLKKQKQEQTNNKNPTIQPTNKQTNQLTPSP